MNFENKTPEKNRVKKGVLPKVTGLVATAIAALGLNSVQPTKADKSPQINNSSIEEGWVPKILTEPSITSRAMHEKTKRDAKIKKYFNKSFLNFKNLPAAGNEFDVEDIPLIREQALKNYLELQKQESKTYLLEINEVEPILDIWNFVIIWELCVIYLQT